MYSVEISHIYQDEDLDYKYLSNLKKSIKKLESFDILDYKIKILIDDLHIKNKKWEVEELLTLLKSENIPVDFIAFESVFSNLEKEVFKLIDTNKLEWITFKKENKKCLFFNNGNTKFALKIMYPDRQKLTCVFLSFCWQLCRLGLLNYPENSILSVSNDNINKTDKTDKTLTLIDKKYQDIENKVFILLKEIGEEHKINYHFFD